MQRIVRKTLLLPVGGVKKMFAWHLEINNAAASGLVTKCMYGVLLHTGRVRKLYLFLEADVNYKSYLNFASFYGMRSYHEHVQLEFLKIFYKIYVGLFRLTHFNIGSSHSQLESCFFFDK